MLPLIRTRHTNDTEHSGTDICVCKRQYTLKWQALFEHFGSKHQEIVHLKARVDQHI